MSESLQIQLKKGVLEMCVLALLSKGDNYAYEIASQMAEAVGMGEGTIYPLMRRMQNDDLVTTYLQESASGPPRKYYKLTKAGAAALKSQRAEWDAFEIAVAKISGRRVMNRAMFLSELRMGLSGLPQSEIEDTISDYESHFSEGLAAGRSEAAIANALGDPARLARELRAEAGFRRWESERSAGSLLGAIVALLGLATLDLIFLVPFVCVVAGILIAMACVAIALAFAGGAVWVVALFPGLMMFGATGMLGSGVALWLAGLGLIAAGIGTAALTWLLLDIVVRGLVQYARLHFRLLDSAQTRRD